MRNFCCILFCMLIFASTTSWARSAQVFLLHSYSQDYPWTKRQHEGFVTELQSRQQADIIFNTEYLDTKRKALEPEYVARFSDYLAMKYSGYKPDAVYVTDDNALEFALSKMDRIFPGIPIFFSGVNDYSVLDRIDKSQVTGVFERKEVAPNLRIFNATDTGKGKIAFVGDGSETYEIVRHEINQELKPFVDIEAVFISASEIDEITRELAGFPYGAVFLTTIGAIKDAAGQTLPLAEIIQRIAQSGDHILFSMEDAYLEPGVLGGYVTSGIRQGAIAARLVSEYLSGKALGDIEPVQSSPNEFIFEQRQLEKHRIVLPREISAQATILHPTPGFYQANRMLVLGSLVSLAMLLILTLAITVIFMSRKSRECKKVATELRDRNIQLLHTKESLVEAQRIAGMGSWTLDLETNELDWSDEIFHIFEIDRKRFTASYESFLATIHPDDRDMVNEAYLNSVKNKSDYEIQHRLLMPDGRIKFVLERGRTHYNLLGKPLRSAGTVQDVTEKIYAEQRLYQWAAVFENTIEGVIITDENARIIDVNRAFSEITGYSKSEVLGKGPNIRRSQAHNTEFYKAMWESIQETGTWSGEIWNRKKNGELSPEWLTISTLYDDKGNVSNYVGVFTDISVIKRSEEKLEQLATHDPLTGLPNRTLLHDRLEGAIGRAARSGEKIAVMFLDLDRFKIINDTLGHVVGDKLLRQAAMRMKEVLRECDTIGRQGGDEFLAIIEDCVHLAQVEAISNRIRERIAHPFDVDKQTLFIGVSVGISLFPDDGDDAVTLIRNADSAMYQAKRMGRNNIAFYDAALTREARKRMELDIALRTAIDKDEFRLYYQPKIDLKSGSIVGAEALIRWMRDGNQLVRPDDFIPIAEETGLILSIGEWVLEESARQMRAWLDSGYLLQHLAINLSAVQIQRGNIASIMHRVIEKYRLQPSQFELEITESVLFDHPGQAKKVLTELRDIGLSLAMDDFGTGFSSLINLKQYPIDIIKIDRSFVSDLLVDANDEAITKAVIAMGKSLELKVVAEGVEEKAQADYLKALGCDQAQGYLFSPPVPAAEFECLLQQQ